MKRECTIVLLHDVPGTHGVHEAPAVERRTRYAVRTSVSRAEFYQAGSMGIVPTCVFTLAVAELYDNELYLEYRGEKYKVIRTYETRRGGIELTVQRGDAE